MEVLFTLIAERYERRSVLITTNLVFSKWDQIFKDPMTTAAAIDRVIHHAVILELNMESYRAEKARERHRPIKTETTAPQSEKNWNGTRCGNVQIASRFTHSH